jgi:hypothetical protein
VGSKIFPRLAFCFPPDWEDLEVRGDVLLKFLLSK